MRLTHGNSVVGICFHFCPKRKMLDGQTGCDTMKRRNIAHHFFYDNKSIISHGIQITGTKIFVQNKIT